ncbi:MAG: tetratricopeptide repeat protein [Bdellovibrionaceae bacterium]|nr:tetratricopeptide repeat protein [Pseudobdellovibrionaceae bacterium]
MKKLSEASVLYYSDKNYDGYLKCSNLLLRMYAEMEDYEKINEIKEKLQDLVVKDQVELNAKSYYSLGLCAAYKRQFKMALEYLEKSLAVGLAKDNKEDICFAINGLCIVYTFLGRLEDALKEIYNLQVFFQVMPLEELQLSSQLMNGHILRKMGKYDEALNVFWQCYEILKTQKNIYMYLSLLYAMGVTYQESGDYDLARLYLNLAKKSVDPKNLKYLTKLLDSALKELGEHDESSYDLIFNFTGGSAVERKKGKIDFKNQFILLDLLKLFVQNPGQVYSKETLVEKVWKQNYDPSVHDNKIYVTIKRLRRLIEPEYDKPKYIFRAKNGYYLNKSARILLD